MGRLSFVAEPCVGMLNDAVYFPISVSVRKGSRLVYRHTVAAGREHTLVLPLGTYLVSAPPYDRAVEATLTAGTVAQAHLTNGCK